MSLRTSRKVRPKVVAPMYKAPMPSSALALPERTLQEKYRALCERYQKVVRRLEEKVQERLVTSALALWALRSDHSPMALVTERAVETANPAFHRLCQLEPVGSGAWRRLAKGAGRPKEYPNLRMLLIAEAAMILEAGRVPPETLYCEREGGAPIFEIRFERTWSARGQPRRAVALFVDVTERVHIDRALTHARELLVQHERVGAIGQLATGVAHDLNNMLQALSMRFQLVNSAAADSERQQKHREAIDRILGNVTDLVGRLQDLARHHDRPIQPIAIDRVVREAIELARTGIEHRASAAGIHLLIAVEMPSLPRVQGDAADLRRVLVNLLLNARDAMPQGGVIQVSAVQVGQQVSLSVVDQGTGIVPEALERLFEPFFTTKGKAGTGLGLAMARDVMRRFGGDIRASNRPEGGAEFILDFLVAE